MACCGDLGRFFKNPTKQLKDWTREAFDPKSWENLVHDVAKSFDYTADLVSDVAKKLEAFDPTGLSKIVAQIGDTTSDFWKTVEQITKKPEHKPSKTEVEQKLRSLANILVKNGVDVKTANEIVKQCQFNKECLRQRLTEYFTQKKKELEDKQKDDTVGKEIQKAKRENILKAGLIGLLGYFAIKGR